MPQLSELVGKKKFVKKEYRPWDLSGKGTVDGKDKPNPAPVKQETNQDIEKESVTEEKILVNEQVAGDITTTPVIEKSDNVTGNVSDNKEITTTKQLDNVKVTKQKHQDNNRITIRKQRDNVIGNVIDNTEGQIYLIDAIKKLTGIQKNLFYYVINLCSARNALDTGNILSSDLANAANCTVGCAKTSLVRLVEKSLVLRLQGKACRGGHMVLGITNEIQAAAIQAQQALFNPFKITRTDNITDNTTSNISPYSSSIYKNNITTSLPEEWKKINFEGLEHIGFSETQIRQLYNSNMTTSEIVQDSINRFAYSLEYSDKAKAYSDPLNVLMGLLRKGNRWIEPNYIEPKELALRQMVEEARKKKEQREALVKELIELEFPEWRRRLTQEQINEIVPADVRRTGLSAAILSSLRTYFTEKILLPKISINGDGVII